MVCLPEHFAYMTHEPLKIGRHFKEHITDDLFKRYRQLALDN